MTHRPQAGVTLIELLVTLSIAVILMAIAVPGLQDFFRRNRVDSAASELMATLNYARSEAIRRGTRVIVCKSNNASTCNTNGNDWEQGWIVLIAGGQPMRVQQPIPSPLRVRANAPFEDEVVFRPDGRITENVGGSLFICHGSSAQDARRVVINSAGRVRVEPATSCS